MLSNLGINLLDIIIIAVIMFYAHEGYMLGFLVALMDLASFIASFVIALKFYPFVADLLLIVFQIPIGIANAVGFFLLAFISEVLFSLFLKRVVSSFPRAPIDNRPYKFFKKIDHLLGVFPGMISAFIVLAFILSVIVSLPSTPLIKNLATGSKIGSRLIANTSFIESKLNAVFGGALNDTLNFLTVKPESDETVELRFRVSDGKISKQAENEMFTLVNKERVEAGLPPVVFDESLAGVGRLHSQDMFERGYFSHYTPEGLDPFDRMDKAGIEYGFAGENLALAPSVELAMQGLMNSPGHRRNILDPNFKKIGIGAIDGGVYGLMFSQEFSD